MNAPGRPEGVAALVLTPLTLVLTPKTLLEHLVPFRQTGGSKSLVAYRY